MCVPTHLHFTQSGYNLEIEYAQDYSQKLTGMTPSNLAKHAPQGCHSGSLEAATIPL